MELSREPLDRRSFLRRVGFTAGGVVTGAVVAKTPGARAAERGSFTPIFRRPQLTHGVQSGDVTRDGAVIWARADGPAVMSIELDTHGSFRSGRHVLGPVATPSTDLTAQQAVRGFAPGQRVSYRVSFRDLVTGRAGEPASR